MTKKAIAVLLFLLISNASFGQLSGNYTIGGTNPDYTTLTQATTAINSIGISGPVVFNIRPGSYTETLYFSGLAMPYTVTFQSETLNSSSVTISPCAACNHVFFNASDMIFNALTIKDTVQSAFYDPSRIVIKNCKIDNSNYLINFLGGGNDTIINSIISADLMGLNCNLYFENNQLNGDLSFGTAYCTNNIINGNIDVANDFFLQNNAVYGSVHSSFGPTIIKKNLIIASNPNLLSVSVGYNAAQFIGNEIHGYSSSFAFADYCQIIGNKFYSKFDIGLTEHFSIFNNFFYENINIGISHNSEFSFNNCANDNGQIFRMEFCQNVSVTNNILPANIYVDDPTSSYINNNDYQSTGVYYETYPLVIDPLYTSTINLHSKNFQLAGKGNALPQVIFDIDSFPRPNPPTIGANEVCISSSPISLFCGDSIQLSFCNLPSGGNYFWQPSAGLSDSTIINPLASPPSSMYYTIIDSVSGFHDSVFVSVLPFQVQTIPDTLIPCGNSIYLTATYNAGAIYSWLPNINLSNANIICPIASPLQTTTFIVTAITNGCGITTDSVTIFVDSMPRAFAQYVDTGLTAYFYNFSTCASNYLWLFGDGSSSSLFEPNHTYSTCGNYFVQLIACNNVGCDTISGNIYMCNVGEEENNSLASLRVYPNPSIDYIFLEFNANYKFLKNLQVKAIDILGHETLLEEQINFMGKHSKKIDISMLNNGIYFLQIKLDKDIIVKKIIIHR